MRVALMQPFYFPWIGLFDIMHHSDLFLVYDDVQFVKSSWQSRNRIKNKNKVSWFSVAVDKKSPLATQIRHKKTSGKEDWKAKNLNQLKEAYRKAPFFSDIFPQVEKMLMQDSEMLLDYSLGSMRLCAKILGITTEIRCSSELGITDCRGVKKVIKLIRAVGGTEFYDGASGIDIYNPEMFQEKGLNLRFHSYVHPEYPQQHGEFVSHLSILDLLMNTGPEALQILSKGNRNF